jgi:hypothetical protein
MSLDEGACTLYKYLCPKPHIENLVNDFSAAVCGKLARCLAARFPTLRLSPEPEPGTGFADLI